MSYTVNFSSHDRQVTVEAGATLIAAAAKAGIAVEGNCGSAGKCGKCKVRVTAGYNGNPEKIGAKFFTAAQMDDGWVLACRYEVDRDLTVEVPKQNDAFSRKTKLNSLLDNVVIDSPIEKRYLELAKPTIEDQTPDFERVIAALDFDIAKQNPSMHLLHIVPRVLRDGKWKVTAIVRDGNLLWLEEGDTTAEKYGMVFDLGTTTVVGLLINLYSGDIVAARAATNPQNVFGADVISRINHIITTKGEGLSQLHEKITTCVNELAQQTIAEAGIDKNHVYECTVVGNTTMSELFANVDATYLAPAPFIPAYAHSVEIMGRELGIELNPQCIVHLLPNIAGYVGADTVGVILGTHIHERPQYVVAIDVGTNGEIMLAGNGRILTCSTAAGPAFEGAQIKHGMRAADGAIEEIVIDNAKGTVEIVVIGNRKPKGICGSGILDAVAQLYLNGIINSGGGFNADSEELHPALKERLRSVENGYEFVLCYAADTATGEDIVICQKDVRELQLGKGAIYAGIKVLMGEMGITLDDLKEVLIAGAFGSYIRTESALAIGLFPKLNHGQILSIGNAASEGARLALVAKQERALCEELARRSEYIELSSRMDFMDEFIMAMSFPE